MKLEKLDVDRYVEARVCNLLEIQYRDKEGTARRIEEHFCASLEEGKITKTHYIKEK